MFIQSLRRSLILSCWTLATFAFANDLWTVDIDLDPAPSPEDGPPFSRFASRNLELLPYQIVGIVGSYVVAVLLLGGYAMTFGRSSRKQTQELSERPVEMVKPAVQTFDPSPISPNASRSWPRRLLSQKSMTDSMRSGRTDKSPNIKSVASFDANVLEADRLRRQDELERLYAAVMDHDERRTQISPVQQEEAHLPPPPQYSQARPLTIDTSDYNPYPSEPRTPRTPGFSDTPLSPGRSMYAASPIGLPASPGPSFSQRSSAGPKKIRKSLKSLKIYSGSDIDDNSDGARTPLTPRVYFDPGIPPEPPITARTIDGRFPERPSTARTVDGRFPEPPLTGRTLDGRFPEDRTMPSITIDEPRTTPRPHPSRTSSNSSHLTIQTIPTRAPAASVNNPLPFRQLAAQQRFHNNQRSRLIPPGSATSAAFPLSPTAPWNMPASAGPVKTTFLDIQRDRLGGGLRTGAATPYSPYMPFTPITPVTPYLPSRRERKQREKEQRQTHGVLTEEDEVKDDKDLWGDGY